MRILLLHGLFGDPSDFDLLIDELQGIEVIAFPLSTLKLEPFNFETVFFAIHEDLKAKNFLPCHLIGYSMGGRIAFYLWMHYRNSFLSCQVIGSHLGLSLEEKAERKVWQQLWIDRFKSNTLANFFNLWYGQPLFENLKSHQDFDVLLKKRVQIDQQFYLNCLEKLDVSNQACFSFETFEPIFFHAGTQDLKFRKLYEKLETIGYKVSLIEGASHAIHIEKPKLLANHLLRNIMLTQEPLLRTWTLVKPFSDIIYEKSFGVAKISINRPEVHNAFTPQTVDQLIEAFHDARFDETIGVIILTGTGDKAFCSGGDQKIRGKSGYQDVSGSEKLNVLDLQKMIKSSPKPVIAMVKGYAIGGGHVLHVICDLTIAAENAIFGQTGPKVGSFDGGFGASYLASIIGQKKAREIWFLCRQYSAKEALDMGLVNAVVPLCDIEKVTLEWCDQILKHSPIALRCLKAAFNADTDGQAGIQELAGNATMLYYMCEEAQEGHQAYLEKRKPNFSKFPKRS